MLADHLNASRNPPRAVDRRISATIAATPLVFLPSPSEGVSRTARRPPDVCSALNRIVTHVADTNSLAVKNAAGAPEQASGLQQVKTAVRQMDQVTRRKAVMVARAAAASHRLWQETLPTHAAGSARHGPQAATDLDTWEEF